MILVTGACGFVGSHLVKGLTAEGHKVRALVRDGEHAERIKGKDVELFIGDVTDPESLEGVAEGCFAVIHLVGIIQPGPGYTFKSIHEDGTTNVIAASKDSGSVMHFIYQSALGTRKGAVSEYHKTKYIAEELTRGSGMNYTITRPSIIFGKGDGFTTRLTQVIRMSPVVPVIGPGKGLLQPVYIDDLVKVFVKITGNREYYGRTLELGGPEELTFDEVVEDLKAALHTVKPTLHVPSALVRPAARIMEKLLPHPPVTIDQLIMLDEDNITGENAIYEFVGKPVSYREGLKKFLK
ncbi:MAG TPA: complex I NDUFA9 subunit family protein [Nitrospirota bacterium]|jgi:NADH dehydrogenase